MRLFKVSWKLCAHAVAHFCGEKLFSAVSYIFHPSGVALSPLFLSLNIQKTLVPIFLFSRCVFISVLALSFGFYSCICLLLEKKFIFLKKKTWFNLKENKRALTPLKMNNAKVWRESLYIFARTVGTLSKCCKAPPLAWLIVLAPRAINTIYFSSWRSYFIRVEEASAPCRAARLYIHIAFVSPLSLSQIFFLH